MNVFLATVCLERIICIQPKLVISKISPLPSHRVVPPFCGNEWAAKVKENKEISLHYSGRVDYNATPDTMNTAQEVQQYSHQYDASQWHIHI